MAPPPAPRISMTQEAEVSDASAGIAALGGLGVTEGATAGSDAAADAVSDSIKDMFNLADTAVPVAKAAPPASKATPAAKAPPAPKVAAKAPAEPKVAAPPAPKAVKAPPAPKVVKVPPAPKALKVVKAPPSPKALKVTKAPTAPKATKETTKTTPKAKQALVSKAATKTTPKHEKPKPVAKAPEKVEELEAEVSALKAKLATTPAPAAVKAVVKAPAVVKAVVKAPVTAPAIVKAAAPVVTKVASPKVQQPKKIVPAEVSVRSALSTRVVSKHHPKVDLEPAVHEPAVHEPELADLDSNFESSNYAAPAHEAPMPAAEPAAQPTALKVAAPPKVQAVVEAAAPAVLTTQAPAAELTMTMVPTGSGASNSILAPAVPQPVPVRFFGSFGHWFHSMFFGADAPPAALPTLPPKADPDADRPAFSTQNIERTAEAAFEDGMGDIAIGDEFARKEQDDVSLVDQVKREDRALRVDAQTPKRPSMPAPSNFRHEAGSTHISQFWGTLAEEDADIEQALAKDGDDLSEYERLKGLQDARLGASVSEISGPRGSHLAMERNSLRHSAASAA